ncbi:hypothetical protein BSKO_05026 [Bryopsis sp. KO-2023]|nr:hypothetical protein BSKO_05026 [Bryopsis sp. KO-2023]
MRPANCICLVLSLLYVGHAAGETTPAAAVNQLAFELLEEYRQYRPHGNVVFSPITISSAFAMVYAGSRGQTKAELEDVFQFEDEVFLALKTKANVAGGKTATTNFAARTFIDSSLQVNPSYAQAIGRDRVATLDFATDTEGAKDAINAFVDEETEGLIPKIVDDTDDLSATRMAIVSAIYFKGQWKYAFDRSLTKKKGFTAADGVTQMVDFMGMKEFQTFRYKNVEELLRMIELPYKGSKFSMFLMLPDEADGWREAERKLPTLGPRFFAKETLRADFFVVEMPKWEMQMEFDGLKIVLKNLGVRDAFSASADLSGISEEFLFLTDVVHMAKIKVDEEGTVGAGVTSVFASKSLVEPEPMDFIVDHPFLYFIVDNRDDTILFQGTVTTLM